MKKRIGGTAASMAAIALSLACGTGGAQDLSQLGGMIPGGSMTSGSMGNVAGLLQYCVQNNVLGGSSGAAGIKDQLLGKMGGSSGATTGGNHTSSGASDMLGQLTGSSQAKKPAASATTGDPTKDAGYLSGAKGILQTGSGSTMDLASVGGGSSDIKAQITKKVCDTVLKQGKSFIGM
ncbi:DUF2501 domain-containing protein [Dyella soli]|uniref:DUF2501 domain-containing protein n=1 Tax=Dyella soli TaxID=522319 RepID=A0A4V2NLV1_9GAMM|nr:DUF2501 domain-containing protein [Dyella soli]TCI10511.1 DUF2501 domain-containing protein [Dyella soli]